MLPMSSSKIWRSVLLSIMTMSVFSAELPKPPVAPKKPKEIVTHDDKRVDNYFWLREKGTPEVTAYLEAENAYAEAVMAPTKNIQESLYKEYLSHLKETDDTAPVKRGDYFYYSRTEKGKNYRIYCRKKGSLDAAEQI